MAVPKRKTSKARKRKRRSHMAVKPMNLAACTQCGNIGPTHVVCPNCGYYMGRTLVETEED
ncbi:50S ribosomal protein L32 [Stratiformator vulcanicus]|uniref:Large ribosomal subunit protein bL32 n=1 Tax=Stratiformator vulcanicus TaxID=2527980 RepID=A0A517R4Q3_9PLAN|nr:50S ribosomal protein L32 [Stratiformator vulcanicus]QDT38866.1 50S ribosomal protein L32 [Stratiformator vulcanicus]